MSDPRTIRLQLAVSAIVGADGRAIVTIPGADRAWFRRRVETIALESDSQTIPEARLYRGRVDASRLIATNRDGRSGQFVTAGTSDVIDAGSRWSLEWSGATPFSECRATITAVDERY
jgi:hypothetical protein